MVVFRMYDKDSSHEQPVAAGLSLEKAQTWIAKQCTGKKWAGMSYTEGEGTRFRRVTNFSEHDWTEYAISKVEWLG